MSRYTVPAAASIVCALASISMCSTTRRSWGTGSVRSVSYSTVRASGRFMTAAALYRNHRKRPSSILNSFLARSDSATAAGCRRQSTLGRTRPTSSHSGCTSERRGSFTTMSAGISCDTCSALARSSVSRASSVQPAGKAGGLDHVPPIAARMFRLRSTTGRNSKNPRGLSAAGPSHEDSGPRSAPSLCSAPARADVPLRCIPSMDITPAPLASTSGSIGGPRARPVCAAGAPWGRSPPPSR